MGVQEEWDKIDAALKGDAAKAKSLYATVTGSAVGKYALYAVVGVVVFLLVKHFL